MTEGCSDIVLVCFTRNYPWSCSNFQPFSQIHFFWRLPRLLCR